MSAHSEGSIDIVRSWRPELVCIGSVNDLLEGDKAERFDGDVGAVGSDVVDRRV